MADRIITVTDPSVVTNDTLSGYNNYSDIDGQLGTTMTPTEATNGHTVALSDGVFHEVTTKPVGTTNGEFTSVVSNAVTVDLSTPSGEILLEGFTGVEDPMTTDADWNVFNAAPSAMTVKKNNNLEFLSITTTVTSDTNSWVNSVGNFDLADGIVMKFNLKDEGGAAASTTHQHGLYRDDLTTAFFPSFFIQNPPDKFRAAWKNEAGTNVQNDYTGYVWSDSYDIKIVATLADVKYYIWDKVDTWDLIDTFTGHGLTGTFKPTFMARNFTGTEIGDLCTVTDVYITTNDYSTLNPV